MCGIAGFWRARRNQEDPDETLNRMAAVLTHRGPDDAGTFFDATVGVGLAFRRLSIIDLSPEGHQPMLSASGRYAIVFNGEVYNFGEIRSELGRTAWRGHSDTEVMLAAIERWGLDHAVRRFVGMFAFALWDRQERKLYLVRDRLGIKPLYYGKVGEDFVFGSELKAIQEYQGFEGEIDRDALALYMRYNYVPSPHCIYRGLHKLRPGCILALTSSSQSDFVQEPFWSAQEVARKGIESPFQGSDVEAVEQLEGHLRTAVGLRMIADVPLGAFLSGGVDSSTVVALMQQQSSRPVKTFTIGFHEEDFDEAAHARRVAAHLQTEHTELYATPQDARDVIPLLPNMYDEPFADVSQIPTYLVSKLARTRVTVSLSGDGGDELFAGYNRYLFAQSVWGLVRRTPSVIRKATASVLETFPGGVIDMAFRAVRPALPSSLQIRSLASRAQALAGYMTETSWHGIYVRTLSYWQDPSSVVLNAREPATVFDSIAVSASITGAQEAMMLTDLVNYLPDDILTKVDRASMAVSLEARVPLLDHRVVEFAWRLPLRLKIRNNISKWVLRQILYKYVPEELIERPKMGFGVPIGNWLRGPLRDWAEDLLAESNLRRHGLFQVRPIREKWHEHISGSRNWQYLLWGVLVFQDWHNKTCQVGSHDLLSAAASGS